MDTGLDPEKMESLRKITSTLKAMKRLTPRQKSKIPSKLRAEMYDKIVIEAYKRYSEWLFKEFEKYK